MKKSGSNSRPRGRKDRKRVSARRGPNHAKCGGGRALNSKRRGELAELAFAYRATTKGFHVAKPYGDSDRYDFVVDNGHRLWRVQVKCTTTLLNGLYHLNSHRRVMGRAVPYRIGEIDFLVAYIFPDDAWFILPIRLIHNRASLLLAPRGYRDPSPHFPCHKGLRFGWHSLQPYREAWPLLRK